MPARDVADRISHCQHGQPESEADPEESDASVGKPAASTALPQPANVSQNVPKNSAPRRRGISMIPPGWMIEEVALFERARSSLNFSRTTGYSSAWQQRRMVVTLQL
jgi:hypothetical protein